MTSEENRTGAGGNRPPKDCSSEAPRVDESLYGEQKRFFERNPRRLATVVFANPRYPRTLRKKMAFVAEQLRGCQQVLEIGTGGGMAATFLLEHLGPSSQYAGVDVALAPLRAASGAIRAARHSVLLSAAAAEALPYSSGTFDGVFCIDVLHHVSSQPRALGEIQRVLRPGGRVVCIEPNPIFPVNLVYVRDPLERKLFEFTSANARAWVEAAGLRDLTLTYLPIFFPGFPDLLAGIYERCESVLGAIPLLRNVSTARALVARR